VTRHSSQVRRFLLIAAHELRLLAREKMLWLALGFFALLVAYAVVNGLHQTRWRDASQAALIDADRAAREGHLAQVQRILTGAENPTPFGNPANPANLGGGLGGQFAVMPSLALTPVALGQSDLFPAQFRVTYASKINFLHGNDIENPWHVLSGHFDLAFVTVYLLPLLIFALGYNLLAGEREDGTLKLLLSQPLAFAALILGKITVRIGVLLAVAVLVPVAVLAVARPQVLQALDVTLWWVALVALYALFWCALAVFVNVLDTSSAANAMMLIVSWVMLVLVVPVLVNIGIGVVSPAPSRAELVTQTRVATSQAMRQNAALLATDYHQDEPAAQGGDVHDHDHDHGDDDHAHGHDALGTHDNNHISIVARPLANARIQHQVELAMRPELEKFDAHMARQHTLVTRLAIVSPAIVAVEGMTALAGTGYARNAHFMAQIDAFHQRWKDFFLPRIEAGQAVLPADFPAIPVFQWQEPSPDILREQARRAVWQLALPIVLLLALTVWRIRRYRVV